MAAGAMATAAGYSSSRASQTPSHSSSDSNATITMKTASARISLPVLAPNDDGPGTGANAPALRDMAAYPENPDEGFQHVQAHGLGSDLSFDP